MATDFHPQPRKTRVPKVPPTNGTAKFLRERAERITQLEAENAKLRAAIEDMRTTTQGYLEGAEWEHWNHYHAERFAAAIKT